jgi:hypothetical protein
VPERELQRMLNSRTKWLILKINSAVSFYSKEMLDGKYPGSLLDDWKDLVNEHNIFSYNEGDCFPATFSHLGMTGYGPKVSQFKDSASVL